MSSFFATGDLTHIADGKTRRFNVLRQVERPNTSCWRRLSNALQKRSRNHARLADCRKFVSPDPGDCRRDE